MINKKTPTIKFFFSLGFLFMFAFVIASPDLFPKAEQQIEVASNFVQYDEDISSDISIDMISVDEEWIDNEVWVLLYVVQPGDVLSKIARAFGTTVTQIQKVNKINGPIRPGQKLVITNDDVWFLYSIKENINVKIFVNTYNLNLEEFMSLNYIQDDSEMLYAGQDVFINITNEQAYNNWLLERPKPVVVIKPKVAYKPVIKKAGTSTTNTSRTSVSLPTKKSTVISQWVYKKNISNNFYAWFCTWYAAIISPEIFPYVSETKQTREFGGNANQWCTNAQKAWFRVVWNSSKNPVTPSRNALVVYSQWGPNYRSYGHVGKVREVHSGEGYFVLEEMNFSGKFIVTLRKDQINNSNIKCYIYGK